MLFSTDQISSNLLRKPFSMPELQSYIRSANSVASAVKKLFFVLLMGAFVSSCAIFETREAELPDDGSRGIFMQPDRPEVVLDNLISSVENMNTVNYLRCLKQSEYRFTPSGRSQINNPDVWASWSYTEEQVYFNNLRAATEGTTGHRLQLANISSELSSSNTRQVVADYSLTVLHNRSNVGVPTLIQGRFVLELESGNDGLWSITSWTDLDVDNSFSWSDLRASFLSN